MPFRPSSRWLRTLTFLAITTLVVADALKSPASPLNDTISQTPQAHGHSLFDSISSKVHLTSGEVSRILRLSSYKNDPANSPASWTNTLFSILFPSSHPAVNALLATLYISGPPNFLLALCPPNIDPASLSIMVSFAVGGLLGDTFFHLLPEIFLGEDDDPERVRLVVLEPKRNLLLGVWIFVGFATFMAMDKGLRIATGAGHSHSHDTHSGSGQQGKEGLEKQAATLHEKLEKRAAKDYRLVQDQLQDLARHESKEETRERLENMPYNDAMVGTRKTRDIIRELAEKNQAVRRRAGTLSDQDFTGEDRGQATGSSYHGQATAAHDIKSTQQSQFQQDTTNSHLVDTSGDGVPDTTTRGTKQQADIIGSNNQQNQGANHENSNHSKREISPSTKLAALLNLLADFTHNITDGLALSSSFYSSPTLGATTTMAVFFHEIPHEVGDFALLIQSGFSKQKAMGAQFVTAIGALLGTVIGICVQEFGRGSNTDGGAGGLVPGAGFQGLTALEIGERLGNGLCGTSLQWADVLLPFTAGTFLYVGTVGVVPELLESQEGLSGFGELARMGKMFGAMALGAGIMVAISWG